MRRTNRTLSLEQSLTLIYVTALLFAPICVRGEEPKTPSGWTPEMMLQVKRISHVRPSPDGKRVAYTVAEAVMTEDRSEFVSQIWLANADGSDATQMTFAAKSSFESRLVSRWKISGLRFGAIRKGEPLSAPRRRWRGRATHGREVGRGRLRLVAGWQSDRFRDGRPIDERG